MHLHHRKERRLGKQCHKRKKENRGYTLVELLVVIAIMAIAVGIAGVSIALASSRDAEKSAKIINSALETSRMYAMSRTGVYTLAVDMEKNELSISDGGEREELPGNVKISIPGMDVDRAEITFDKSTGKVLSVLTDGAVYTDLVLRITSENPRGKKATVVLVVNTGKHFIEYQ